jgi:predicted 3-demethylubiquinone-9 3-methyltransferase (glyoxalase superfamily)
MARVTPFIWFKDTAGEAMEYYASVFPDTRVVSIDRYEGNQGIPGEEQLKGKVLTGVFEVMGQRFMCLDGGEQPGFALSSAISFMVEMKDQDELDAVWGKLADGGTPQQCGWITDKFGVTWQVIPKSLGEMMSDTSATPAQKQALTDAMMPMVKLESAELEEAFRSAA